MGKMNMNKDRFDLENAITNLHSTADDIQTVADMIYDSDIIYNSDKIHSAMTGLAIVLEAKVEHLNRVFCEVFQLNEYAPEEVKKYREQFFNIANEFKEQEEREEELRKAFNETMDRIQEDIENEQWKKHD
jgi:hypothetical protein